MKGIFMIALAVAGSTSWAQTAVVVPNDRATTAGGGSFLGPLSNSGRRYQMLMAASQLTPFLGKNMMGVAFRNTTTITTAWPSAPATYPDYRILMGPGVAPPLRSLTFADNILGTQQEVRSGPITFATDSYPLAGPNLEFGQTIPFTTPFLYTGGDLLMEIRHTGFAGTSRSVDAVAASGGVGYDTLVGATWSSSFTASAGSRGNFSVPKLISGLSLAGTAALLDFEGNLAQLTVIISLFQPGQNNPVASVTAPLSTTGAYTAAFPGLAPGSYDVRAKVSGFLRRKSTANLTESATVTLGFNLLGGDVDNSGEIDLTDIDLIIGKYLEAGPLPEDVNGSGEVDLTDVDIAIGNYLESDE